MSKQALEMALDVINALCGKGKHKWEIVDVIDALKEAIAQQGEPVGYVSYVNGEVMFFTDEPTYPALRAGLVPLYTSAPSIPEGWQLVKTDDIKFCIDAIEDWGSYVGEYFQKKWDLKGDIARAKKILSAAPTYKGKDNE